MLGSDIGTRHREAFCFLSVGFRWANAGYRATTGCENGGKGSNGGVWEWTSTLFDGHEGLAPTDLFTGYSTDFFDTKHQVVVSLHQV